MSGSLLVQKEGCKHAFCGITPTLHRSHPSQRSFRLDLIHPVQQFPNVRTNRPPAHPQKLSAPNSQPCWMDGPVADSSLWLKDQSGSSLCVKAKAKLPVQSPEHPALPCGLQPLEEGSRGQKRHQPRTGLWDKDRTTPTMRYQQRTAALPFREEQLLMRQQPPPHQKIQVSYRLDPHPKLRILSRKRAVGSEGSPVENRTILS